jgi:hypothetical protein
MKMNCIYDSNNMIGKAPIILFDERRKFTKFPVKSQPNYSFLNIC